MENRWQGLNYHHSRPLEFVNYGNVRQNRTVFDEIDAAFDKAFDWLNTQVGFFPLFMAVGENEEAVRSTGWQHQWLKKVYPGDKLRYGEKRNEILFSFQEIENPVFLDCNYWPVIPTNFANGFYDVSERWRKMILKPSWTKSDWIRMSRRRIGVEAVVPELDLTKADLISVRNKTTKQLLEDQGFKNVEVSRIRVKS